MTKRTARGTATLIFAVNISIIIGCGTETRTESGTEPDTTDGDIGPIDNNDRIPNPDADVDVDADADADADNDYLDGWDTGTGELGCMGEFMTAEECLAANGAFDSSLLERHCVDSQVEKCCLTDTLTKPCPYDCMGAAECFDRGGQSTAWDEGYECSNSYDNCCQDPAPLDQDTAQFMGELFDPFTCPVVTPVTIEDQPDKVVSGICTEMMDEDSPFFCPQDNYDRIVRDMAAITAAYPVVAADAGGQIYNGFGDATSPFAILCVPGYNLKNCDNFPKGQWQDILDCFGADHEHCLFQDTFEEGTCGQSHLWFELGVNTKRMMAYFEEHAKGLVAGSLCELDGYFGLTYPLNGFHPTDYGNGIWLWDVRATAQFDLGTAHCDVRLKLSTTTDSTQISEITVENLSDSTCGVAAFDF